MHRYLLFLPLIALFACSKPKTESSVKITAFFAGEPTQHTIVIRARLANTADSMMGMPGYVFFKLDDDPGIASPLTSNILKADSLHDYIVKYEYTNLEANKKYYYKVWYGSTENDLIEGPTKEFTTLPDTGSTTEVSLVMVTGMHTLKYDVGGKGGDNIKPFPPASPQQQKLGFETFTAIKKVNPNYFIGNGDNVYYDHPFENRAMYKPQMRRLWTRLFAMPTFNQLTQTTATYWLKDDHDFRYDDADLESQNKFGDMAHVPSVEDGLSVFLEQVPFCGNKEHRKTYRHIRLNAEAELIFLENRDYRSPNYLPDDSAKSIWGKEQTEWLKTTLTQSKASFIVLVSPTPMVGPDDASKTDNHANIGGFSTEGRLFFEWAKANGIDSTRMFIFCGDRHWQYHSIHPSGFHEFSCGALIDQNSRLGRMPGDSGGTDPMRRIRQPYVQPEASGGFMHAWFGLVDKSPAMRVTFYDEKGKQYYQYLAKK